MGNVAFYWWKSQHLSSPSFNRKILSSFSEIASLFAFLQSQNPRVPPSRSPPSSVLKIKLGEKSQKLGLRTRTPHSSATIADSKSLLPPTSASNS
ncbi:hypothetical protein QL285_077541 [Trifolium repens]|nr:hypothetical protein QL285_077541 [Trifolium repens]